MRRVDVLYFVEHVAREFDIACAIRHLAHKRFGLGIQIASILFGLKTAIKRYRPRVVAVPYFYSARDGGIEQLLANLSGVSYVNLAFEHLFSDLTENSKRPRDEFARERVIHLAAGDLHRNFLCEAGVLPENVDTIGSLACCLYRDPYRAYFEHRREAFAREYGLDPAKPWVFFPENYGAAFLDEKAIDGRVSRGWDRASLRAFQDYARKSFEIVMPWCWDVARLGTVELVIRPRPATAGAIFVNACREVAGELPSENLHVIEADSVREWILASDLVISSYSTSLIEAAVARKPTYMVSPSALRHLMTADWFDHTPQLGSREELLGLMEKPENAVVSEPLRAWVEDHLLRSGDSIARAAELLAAIHRGERDAPVLQSAPRSDPAHGARRRSRGPIRAWRRRRRKARHRSLRRTALYEQDSFSAADIHARTARWSKVLARASHHVQ